MSDLPTGTVTFLFTDIEGSTRLWEQHPEAMRQALVRHDRILFAAIERHGGSVFKTMGDAFCAAFASAPAALAAALDAQRALLAGTWEDVGSLRVRMGLHTGVAEERDGDYFGPPVNRVARLVAAGHGSQVLLSLATQEEVQASLPSGVELRHLGERRLKGLPRPESIFQLVAPDLPGTFPPLTTLDVRPTNLPWPPTSFVGREREIATLCGMLRRPSVRLITLTGPGGTGKTRLSLQVAAELLDEFEHGAFFVELAFVREPALVLPAIAHALGVAEEAERPLIESLKQFLRDRQQLLVVDNFEQVLDAAPLITELLAAAPRVKALVSSREALHLYGEYEFAVPPLALPELDRDPDLDLLSRCEAVALFTERSQARRWEFALTPQNAAAVAEICVRVDGLPLALELAAARSSQFTPEQLREQLRDRLALLTGGFRDLPARQQTLRATIDWSYDLLTEGERTLLQRLSVFAGWFSREAAEAVCGDCELRIANCELGAEELPVAPNGDPRPETSPGEVARPPAANSQFAIRNSQSDVLDLLSALVDKSLVQFEERENEAGYRLLETIREYGAEKLAASGEGETVRLRHRDWFLGLAERADPELTGREQQEWLSRLERSHDDLRAALAGSTEHGEADACLRLGAALWRFWEVRGYLTEGRQRLQGVLALPGAAPRTVVRARVLSGAAGLAYRQGDYPAARALAEESLAIQRESGSPQAVASSLNNLGNLAHYQGDQTAARALYEESLTLRRSLGDREGVASSLYNLGNLALEEGGAETARALFEESLVIRRELGHRQGIARTVGNLGILARQRQEYEGARRFFEESLAIHRELGDPQGIAASLNNLGFVALDQGEHPRARLLLAESLALYREMGDRRSIAFSLEGLAAVAAAQGQPERAARLCGAAEALRQAIGSPLSPSAQAGHERQVAAVRAALGEEAFAAAWAEGRSMTLDESAEFALQDDANA